MKSRNKTALALGTLAGSLALSGGAFAIQPLESAYMGDTPPARQAEGKCGFKRMDANGDGKVSREEFAAAHDGKDDQFASHDLDGDGNITQAEMDQYRADKKKAAEGKCGEGKCGAQSDEGKNDSEGKCGAGKCGGSL
ncbi:calcium-binding protein [Lysobacter pythonis]|uniref:Calcium-binding protein n=1 Tax=Solilutibacter pythonis TaxID=2483112 RepID=A0A3M2I434_9GAMM|nr:calcium-binding protein [Lysobacter pythonis]RMH92964.1 calcium-binding protein [Lysobacter pythonis]